MRRLVATAALLVGCVGNIGDAPDVQGTGSGALCAAPQPGGAPLRRLSHAEYRNTVTDLIGHADLVEEVTRAFSSETESLGFRNNAAFLTVNSLQAQQYMDAAEQLAEAAVLTGDILPCAAGSGDDACAAEFIETFGAKAFRRPVTAEEAAAFDVIYDEAKKDGFAKGIEWVLFTMLQSPHFLYRVEFGTPSSGGVTQPSGYEMASRLSYLIWQSMPDDELFAAAEQGGLADKAAVAAQARRMLEDPRAKRLLDFFAQWLDVDRVPDMTRDETVFPEAAPELGALLAEEAMTFFEQMLFEENASFEQLMSAPYSYLNAALAAHYQVDGPSGAAFERVDMPGRAGLLTLGGVVAAHDKPTRTSIVLRGLKLRTDFLCQTVGAPPGDVVTDLPDVGEGLTQAERLAEHRTDPQCAACHDLMDPLGSIFEGFDALGRSRTVDENGLPVSTSGEITKTKDIDGPVNGPTDLAARFADSPEVRDCFMTQTFRYFYGRNVTSDDVCSMDQLQQAFDESDRNILELIVALTQTDAFLYRPAAAAGGEP